MKRALVTCFPRFHGGNLETQEKSMKKLLLIIYIPVALVIVIGALRMVAERKPAPTVDTVAAEIKAVQARHMKVEHGFDCASLLNDSDRASTRAVALHNLNCVINLQTEDQQMQAEVEAIAQRANRPLPTEFLLVYRTRNDFYSAYAELLSYAAYTDVLDAAEREKRVQKLNVAKRAFREAEAKEEREATKKD
jgi:hypothetical protein